MTTRIRDWKWFGNAGHFICSRNCQFHLCTQVGKYLVSTVGEFLPEEGVREILAKSRKLDLQGKGDERLADWMKKNGFEDIGCDRKFETMVFLAGKPCDRKGCGCGMPLPDNWSELDFSGYNTVGEATNGHMEMCRKYSRKS